MATNRDIAHEHGSGEYDDWPGESIPLTDQFILVAALLCSAAALVQLLTLWSDEWSISVLLAVPVALAIAALFTGWEYAYSPAIGLCLLFGLLGLMSSGVVVYLPLAGLLVARFVRAEHRRGEPEPFSNGALGVMFLTTGPLLFYLLWLGERTLDALINAV